MSDIHSVFSATLEELQEARKVAPKSWQPFIKAAIFNKTYGGDMKKFNRAIEAEFVDNRDTKREWKWKIRHYADKENGTDTIWGLYVDGLLKASYGKVGGSWTIFVMNPLGMNQPVQIYEVESRDWAMYYCTQVALGLWPESRSLYEKKSNVSSVLPNMPSL